MFRSYELIRAAGNAFAWVYLHQSGRFDTTSGLYHFRHRDYSPTLGRWTSLDPLRYEAGDVNLYRALGNKPISRLDPTGLLPPDPPFPINEAEWEAVKAFQKRREAREAEVTWRMRQKLTEHTKNWNDADRQKAFSELDRLLHTAKNTPYRQAVTGNCYKWAFQVMDKFGNPKTKAFTVSGKAWEHRFIGIPFTDHWFGHFAIEVRIGDSVFYMDEGFWGFYFELKDIPWYYKNYESK